MSDKSNVVTIEEAKSPEEVKEKTSNKYLKRAEKIVRKLDNVLTDLVDLAHEASDLETETEVLVKGGVTERDYSRFTEMSGVLAGTVQHLYHLTNRMSRKYVGKEIEPFDLKKRKSLKKK